MRHCKFTVIISELIFRFPFPRLLFLSCHSDYLCRPDIPQGGFPLLFLFEELAEKDLERFRLLGELFLALGEADGQKTPRYPYHKRSTASRNQDSPALSALWERRRNIDCYETLMGRTEDRVVRSVFSKLLSTEHLLCRRLESACKK